MREFAAQETTCGVGAWASTGVITCTDVGGVASYGDPCVAGTPTTESPGNRNDETCNCMAADTVMQLSTTGSDDAVGRDDDDHYRTDDHERDGTPWPARGTT